MARQPQTIDAIVPAQEKQEEALSRWQRGQKFFGPTGLNLPAKMTEQQWNDLREALRSLDSVSQWNIADFCARQRDLLSAAIEKKMTGATQEQIDHAKKQAWKMALDEIAEYLSKPAATLKYWLVVLDNWPAEYRIAYATFSHHARVPAKLGTPEERHDWLVAWLEQNSDGDKIGSVRKLESDVETELRQRARDITENGDPTEEAEELRNYWKAFGLTDEVLRALGDKAQADETSLTISVGSNTVHVEIGEYQGNPCLVYSLID